MRELLAPIFGWFTEGFDTLDLKQAKGTSLRFGVTKALAANVGCWPGSEVRAPINMVRL
jgi:hypothetical protein